MLAPKTYERHQRPLMMSKWNKTSDGYPTSEKPVLVCNGKFIYAALATYVYADESEGWLWEVMDGFHGALNDAGTYECDDDYQFDYWMDMPEPPEQS